MAGCSVVETVFLILINNLHDLETREERDIVPPHSLLLLLLLPLLWLRCLFGVKTSLLRCQRVQCHPVFAQNTLDGWTLGEHLVHTWCTIGEHLVYNCVCTWCSLGVHFVYNWCTLGEQLVHIWCTLGEHLVCTFLEQVNSAGLSLRGKKAGLMIESNFLGHSTFERERENQ